MVKNKFVIVAIAGMLAMCVGLTACGGNSASSSAASSSASASSASASASASSSAASSAASSSAASSVASSAAASDAVAYWEGTLSDGSTVSFNEDEALGMAGLCVLKADLSDGALWLGTARTDVEGATIVTDNETGNVIKYTIVEKTPELLKLNVDGYGEVELKPVSEAEYQAFVQKLEKAGKKLEKKIAKKAQKFMDKFNKLDGSTILFWDGVLTNGNAVTYMDDQKSGQAFLSIVKPNLSDGVAWYGSYTTSDDGKTVTITDEESKETVTFKILESTDTSMKIDIDWYGQTELKSYTKDDFVKYVEELSKLAGKSSSSAASGSSSAASSSAASSNAA